MTQQEIIIDLIELSTPVWKPTIEELEQIKEELHEAQNPY